MDGISKIQERMLDHEAQLIFTQARVTRFMYQDAGLYLYILNHLYDLIEGEIGRLTNQELPLLPAPP